ncbi:MAG TPA: F0F1 ATP synthase subunit A [Verrucomicrobiae bacterium]|nr:F0F1 ATP synthase subunit A [Verrucomicrobiae bacterium]
MACAIFAAVFAVSLKAQPASPSAPTAGVSAASGTPAAETGSELVPAAPPVLFTVLGLPVTNSMICTWIVAALIIVIVRVTTWKSIREIPSGGQNVMETLIEAWERLINDILDKRVAGWVFPFATTFFIFIVVSNLVDLVPGVGSIGSYHHGQFMPFFRPPTTDANLTVAMAGIFLVMSLYWAVRYDGFWGLIKHIFGVKMQTNKWAYPLFFLLFIFIGAMELLSIGFARPVALAMRLYGNIFAGESILEMIFHNQSWLLGLVLASFMYFYETFVCIVQAFVFAMLVVAFVGTMCTHTEENGH